MRFRARPFSLFRFRCQRSWIPFPCGRVLTPSDLPTFSSHGPEMNFRAALPTPRGSLRVFGEPLSPMSELLEAATYDLTSVVDLPGEFWVALEDEQGVALASSRNATVQAFYCQTLERLYYNGTVGDVIRSSGITPTWNPRAIATFFYLGHTLGCETLQRETTKLGPGEVIHSTQRRLTSTTAPAQSRRSVQNPQRAAIEALTSYVQRYGTSTSYLSISAGFDSRVLLAALLASGFRPDLIVTGREDATDVRIARSIAADFQLRLIHVEPNWEDWLTFRERISNLTSGTSSFENWHTYTYMKAAGLDPTDTVFVGTNGEFVRTFYADRGIPFLISNLLSPIATGQFWKRKLGKHVPQFPFPDKLHPEFARYFKRAGLHELMQWLTGAYGTSSLGKTIDEFYLRERIRNLMSNGLVLYRNVCLTRTPFLDSDWIEAARQMPRLMKLGSQWHRYAISQLCPKLLKYPTDESGRPMGTRPPVSYWMGRGGHGRTIGYVDYPSFYSSDIFLEPFSAALPLLTPLLGESNTRRLTDEIRGRRIPASTTGLIAALAFWAECMSTAPVVGSPSRA